MFSLDYGRYKLRNGMTAEVKTLRTIADHTFWEGDVFRIDGRKVPGYFTWNMDGLAGEVHQQWPWDCIVRA